MPEPSPPPARNSRHCRTIPTNCSLICKRSLAHRRGRMADSFLFTALRQGQLPPKSSIREIRINQNPFSSEYDKLGYGRIEVFTKPGTDKFHGQFLIDSNDSAFNTHDPFISTEPAYDSTLYNGSIGGPINKKSSFFVSVQRRDINSLSAINAIDPTTFLPFSATLPNPHERTNIAPRL